MHYSVLIGRASTIDRQRVFACLDALGAQDAGFPFEVIVADRCNDEVTAQIRRNYPDVLLIHAPAGTSLPLLRCLALDAASGKYIATTEDHCIPAHDWLSRMNGAFAHAAPDTVAVGGSVENVVADTSFDRANFLCEYSALLPPLANGVSSSLPGMNVAYSRDALLAIGRAYLQDGFWESTVHPALLANGGRFHLDETIRVRHAKRFSVAEFLWQRYLYSRYYAAWRSRNWSAVKRWLYAVALLLLPPVLLSRMIFGASGKAAAGGSLLAVLPWLAVFTLVMIAGELRGQLFGDHGALTRIE